MSYQLSTTVTDVVKAVREWMTANKLKLNINKTQYMWLGTPHKLLQVDGFKDPVTNLGVAMDPDLSMKSHTSKEAILNFHVFYVSGIAGQIKSSLGKKYWQFVKELDKEVFCTKFQKIGNEKLKAGIFDGPNIRMLMKDNEFIKIMNELELNA
ncbi:hypothetical protein HELRODRAFT_166821 [Helobdella robusta]|uniref:Reverse transcriptase domain-containing protein n=1 Tax=Helobdella robusta TaxID=6412 RepID=T1EYK5_HELRO|nr:hypothetical protein HELRODRAFT_166821 [Helobdella robusta]ESO11779.1 hypothetical protein HELRODRAFT_166821 [Helobdella robusta]